MNEDKLNEIETLLDGIDFARKEINTQLIMIENYKEDIRNILQGKDEVTEF